MQITKLTADFSVSPQITVADIPAVVAQGFGSIVCNRPDGEAADQPRFAEIEAAAKAQGLTALYLPVSGMPGAATIKAFDDAWAGLPKPVLGYCRSGMRSSAVWSASRAARAGAALSAPGIMGGVLRRLGL